VSKLTVGIVDYGVGNLASVRHSIHAIGIRCRITDRCDVLDNCDILLLPGVGAFKPAMRAIRVRGLEPYLREQALCGRPILGLCLGMQLLTEASVEGGYEEGLGIIPGKIVPLDGPYSHIGWNTVEMADGDPLFEPSDGHSFYFNHSYRYEGLSEYQVCKTTLDGTVFGSAIRHGNVIGLQFHPEKSQSAGRNLLKRLINGL